MYKLKNGSKLLNDFRSPEKQTKTTASVKIPDDLLSEIDEIAEKSEIFHFRSEVMRFLLNIGMNEVDFQ